MLKSAQAIAILSGSLLVAGCQSTGGKFARLNDSIKVPEAMPELQRAEKQLAVGREALGQRNYAAAITAFRAASVEPALQPAAQNGLGVAFAGIGREDLAELHFKRAISLDPTNSRYEENLARLYRTQLAEAQARRDKVEARERTLATRGQTETNRRLAKGISVMAPRRRIVLSTNGVAIIHGAPMGEPGNAVAVRRSTPVALGPSSGRSTPLPAFQPAVITASGLRSDHIRPVADLADTSLSLPALPDPAASAVRPAFAATPGAVVSAPGLRPGAAPAVATSGLRPGAAVAVLEKARSPIAVVAQHGPVLARNAGSATPEAGRVLTTGRLYAHAEQASAATVVDSPNDGAAVQLASNLSIGRAVLGPISVRKSILGLGADAASADAIWADLP